MPFVISCECSLKYSEKRKESVLMIRAFFWTKSWLPWAYGGGIVLIASLYFQVQMTVRFNDWYGRFYDLLQKAAEHSVHDFYAALIEFLWIAIPYMLLATMTNYLTRLYTFRWRAAITFNYIPRWRAVTEEIEGASQRIQEDAYRFAKIVESLGVQAAGAAMTLVAFLPILWGLSTGVEVPVIGSPSGSLVWVALVVSAGGMVISWFVGIKLPVLEYNNQKVEAAFRKELVYGEDNKIQFASISKLTELFSGIRSNYHRLFLHYGYFDIWLNLFNQCMVIVPFVVMGPSLFTGSITLGVMMKVSNAFSEVRGSFSTFLSNWTTITELRSIWKRLGEFEANLERHTPVLDVIDK